MNGTCPCCGADNVSLRANFWVRTPICYDCFFVWFDGASHTGGAENVARESRLRQLKRIADYAL